MDTLTKGEFAAIHVDLPQNSMAIAMTMVLTCTAPLLLEESLSDLALVVRKGMHPA